MKNWNQFKINEGLTDIWIDWQLLPEKKTLSENRLQVCSHRYEIQPITDIRADIILYCRI